MQWKRLVLLQFSTYVSKSISWYSITHMESKAITFDRCLGTYTNKVRWTAETCQSSVVSLQDESLLFLLSNFGCLCRLVQFFMVLHQIMCLQNIKIEICLMQALPIADLRNIATGALSGTSAHLFSQENCKQMRPVFSVPSKKTLAVCQFTAGLLIFNSVQS